MPAGTFLRTVQDRGRLVAGVSGDRVLLGSLDPLRNRLEGLEVDLLREVARALFGDEQHLELRAVSEAEVGPLLQRGDLDVVARQVAITCAARQRADLSTPYLRSGQRVLVARDAPTRGLQDLRGKHVCAAAGSPALAVIAGAESHPIPVPAPDWNECMVLFQQGGVDAISADEVILLGFTLQDPYARIVGPEVGETAYALAAGLGQADLVRFLNGVLERMRADGRWAALHDRWLGRFGPAPPPPPAEYRD
jgi:polar amino acid transport system substrate-binding protein